mgnify:CR=1 FL=1
MASQRKLLCTNEEFENNLAKDTDSDYYSEIDERKKKLKMGMKKNQKMNLSLLAPVAEDYTRWRNNRL